MTASNTASSVLAGFAGAGTATLILGIPLAALGAALIGAGLAYVTRTREPDEVIPARLLGILSDAFIGGWLAVALVQITLLHRYGIAAIPVEVLAGLIAVFWRSLRLWLPAKADKAFDAVLAPWANRKGGQP